MTCVNIVAWKGRTHTFVGVGGVSVPLVGLPPHKCVGLAKKQPALGVPHMLRVTPHSGYTHTTPMYLVHSPQ